MYVSKLMGLGSLLCMAAACGGTIATDQVEVAEETSADALAAVFCRGPNDVNTCGAGESCLPVSETQSVCAANRCQSQGDCRDNYLCRLNHCVRIERDPVLSCPRGSVEGRAECPAGSHAVQISREPICSTCERDAPTRPDPTDRCGPNYHPVARGDCRSVLGYYWDGRVCNPLSGCVVTNPDGLFRTQEACARTFAFCNGR